MIRFARLPASLPSLLRLFPRTVGEEKTGRALFAGPAWFPRRNGSVERAQVFREHASKFDWFCSGEEDKAVDGCVATIALGFLPFFLVSLFVFEMHFRETGNN